MIEDAALLLSFTAKNLNFFFQHKQQMDFSSYLEPNMVSSSCISILEFSHVFFFVEIGQFFKIKVKLLKKYQFYWQKKQSPKKGQNKCFLPFWKRGKLRQVSK